MDVEQLHGIAACQKDDVLFHHWHGKSTLGIDIPWYRHSSFSKILPTCVEKTNIM